MRFEIVPITGCCGFGHSTFEIYRYESLLVILFQPRDWWVLLLRVGASLLYGGYVKLAGRDCSEHRLLCVFGVLLIHTFLRCTFSAVANEHIPITVFLPDADAHEFLLRLLAIVS